MSYYGGFFGVCLGVAVAAKLSKIPVIKALNVFGQADTYRKHFLEEQQANAQNKVAIDSLKKVINTLDKKVAESQARVEYANEEVQRTKNEANQKVEEANKRAEEANQKAQKAERDVKAAQMASKQSLPTKKQTFKKSDVQAVIDLLAQVKKKKEDNQRDGMREQAKGKLNKLKQDDPKNASTYQNIITKLGYPIAKQNNDKSNGHYDSLIKDLKSIIE